MLHTISGGGLTAVISEHGAELQSLARGDFEYLYDGSSVWNERAPFLFPIVGRLRDGYYTYAGKKYELGGHGFGRHMNFDYLGGDVSRAVFLLRDNEETLKVYPFHFETYIVYEIDDGRLRVTYDIKNMTDGEMYFSVGAHEGYRCPMTADEKFEDYKLIFEKKETVGAAEMVLPDVLCGNGSVPFLENTDTVQLDYDLFAVDAVVLLGQKSNTLKLVGDKSGRGVEVCFPHFPMLGIWTKSSAHAPYICIEPWFGVCDKADADHNLTHKFGIQKLEKGGVFTCSHTIRPF